MRKLEDRALTRDGLIAFGRALAALLLPASGDAAGAPAVRELLARSLIAIPSADGLRLRLRLPKAVAAIPWEYLYVDTAAGGDGMDGFIALDPRVAIVRHDPAAAPVPTTALEGNLKVVVALASASDLPELDLEAELDYIRTAVSGLDGVDLVPCEHATLDRLQPLLPNTGIFHYAGHGDFTKTIGARPGTYTGSGVLAFEDTRVDAEQLGLNLRSNGVRLVVLAGCDTGRRDGVSVWSGIAPALVAAKVPAVIGNQYRITDTAAVAFSRRLYEAIAGGWPIERAVAAARLAIYNDDKTTRDWGVPVLYMRAGDGNLFAGVADPARRARAAAAAAVDVSVRVGDVGSSGLVVGADLGRRVDGKLSVSVATRDVKGTVIGLKDSKGQQVQGAIRVEVSAGTVEAGGKVIGLDLTETDSHGEWDI